MPFTPFHFGPGFLVKACSPDRFQLSSFIVANVLIDLEVLYFMATGQTPLHQYCHTYVAGIGLGLLAGVGTFGVMQLADRTLAAAGFVTTKKSSPKLETLRDYLIAGLLGGVSHIFLDSCMHHDMHPLWPFVAGSPLAGVIGVGTLHLGLAVMGLLGAFLWFASSE